MVGPPTEEDWSKAEVFVKFLRVFYNVTLRSRHVSQLFRKKLSNIEAQLKTEEIKNILRAPYDEYAFNVEGGKYMNKSKNLQAQHSSTSSNMAMMEDDLIDEWMHFVEDGDEKVVGDEVDSYLFDPLVQITKEESTKYFNILLWWKVNGNKYPILAAIAKYILAIHVSTMASKSAFSTGGRDDAPSIDHIEFYESIESELAKSASSIASLTLDPQPQQDPKQSQGSNSQEPPLLCLQGARSSQAQRPPKPSKNKCPTGKGKGKAKV
ncbi:hypothetical protein ACFX2G_022155 [Malus domestica]